MNIYYDLHIHSALSPCADNDMTPNNIVNMARLKGLDAIAVCDHNCADNVRAVAAAAREAGLVFVPGIELNTAEEAHLLVFFDDCEKAARFGEQMYQSLPELANDPEFFGNQYVLDQNDEIVGQKEKLLISALPYSLDECCEMAKEHGGVAVPAHINKEANSILANLGFIPGHIHFPTIEVWPGGMEMDANGYRLLHDSDAHSLGQIAERAHSLEVEEKTAGGILKTLLTEK